MTGVWVEAMRSLFVVLFAVAACAHQEAAPAAAPTQLEHSVFPLYVAQPSPVLTGGLFGFDARRPAYRACAAAFVAPGVLVTSASAFPSAEDGPQLLDAGDAMLLDGDYALSVERVVAASDVPGLVFVQTRERGQPVALRGEPLTPHDPLRRIAYDFVPAARRYADAKWSVAPARALPFDDRAAPLAVSTELRAGQCGALLLDAQGRLAGIVRQGTAQRGEVIEAWAIQRALGQLGQR